MKAIFVFAAILIFSCSNENETHPKAHYPNEHYNYVSVLKTSFATSQQYYVPVYSSIYAGTGEKEFLLTATLSIRNIGFTDSLYISKIYYYGSDGQLLKKYIDSTVLLKPMTSMEVVVNANEKEGGAGANFVVECMGNNLLNDPLIQTIMTTSDLRASFAANAVKIISKKDEPSGLTNAHK